MALAAHAPPHCLFRLSPDRASSYNFGVRFVFPVLVLSLFACQVEKRPPSEKEYVTVEAEGRSNTTYLPLETRIPLEPWRDELIKVADHSPDDLRHYLDKLVSALDEGQPSLARPTPEVRLSMDIQNSGRQEGETKDLCGRRTWRRTAGLRLGRVLRLDVFARKGVGNRKPNAPFA